MYKASYKCRICQQEFSGPDGVDSFGKISIIEETDDNRILIIHWDEGEFRKRAGFGADALLIHDCPTGDKGIADFIGLRRGYP